MGKLDSTCIQPRHARSFLRCFDASQTIRKNFTEDGKPRAAAIVIDESICVTSLGVAVQVDPI
jgi:hypothetical protein